MFIGWKASGEMGNGKWKIEKQWEMRRCNSNWLRLFSIIQRDLLFAT